MFLISVSSITLQAPRERRSASSGVKPTDLSTVSSSDYGSLEILDHHLQALRSMPVNLSLSDNSTAQHPGSKHRATHAAEDPREGDGNSGGAVALVKTEGQKSKTMSCSGGSYIEEPSADQIKAAYEQSCYNRSLVGYLKTEQRRAPDGVHEDAAEGEVREVALGGGGFPLWKQQCNIVFFFHRCTVLARVRPPVLKRSTAAYQRMFTLKARPPSFCACTVRRDAVV